MNALMPIRLQLYPDKWLSGKHVNYEAAFRFLPLLLLLLSEPAESAEKEIWYQRVWCEGKGGMIEHKLNDGRRVDCLTNTHAIEMDFASKWPEAIGQSLDYSMLTGKKAGIVLILEKGSDLEHWRRLKRVIRHYQLPIKAWRLGP